MLIRVILCFTVVSCIACGSSSGSSGGESVSDASEDILSRDSSQSDVSEVDTGPSTSDSSPEVLETVDAGPETSFLDAPEDSDSSISCMGKTRCVLDGGAVQTCQQNSASQWVWGGWVGGQFVEDASSPCASQCILGTCG